MGGCGGVIQPPRKRNYLAGSAHSTLGVVLAALTLACLWVVSAMFIVYETPQLVDTYSGSLELAALEDLDHDGILVGCAEFVLESGLAGGVENTLGTVSVGH